MSTLLSYDVESITICLLVVDSFISEKLSNFSISLLDFFS